MKIDPNSKLWIFIVVCILACGLSKKIAQLMNLGADYTFEIIGVPCLIVWLIFYVVLSSKKDDTKTGGPSSP
jgi:hypothetical protein